ncbi:MAG: DUF6717 family protein [Planctomycetota bacterium]
MIQTIHPYKHSDLGWVFDDPAKGLDKEGLVLGIDTLLDQICERFQLNPVAGFDVEFSDEPIDNPAVVLQKLEEIEGQPEVHGTNYLDEASRTQGWLCPNLLKYFESPPNRIYCRIRI